MSKGRQVLFPASHKGLNPGEITIAELMKEQGYATACIGKWHLGDQLPFLPTRQGFDYYYGIPYSNDMDCLLYTSKRIGKNHACTIRGKRGQDRSPDEKIKKLAITTHPFRFVVCLFDRRAGNRVLTLK